jgi:hypothetical protein
LELFPPQLVGRIPDEKKERKKDNGEKDIFFCGGGGVIICFAVRDDVTCAIKSLIIDFALRKGEEIGGPRHIVGKHWREWKLKKHCFQGNEERWRRRRSLRSHHHTSQSQPTTFFVEWGRRVPFFSSNFSHPSPFTGVSQ